MKELKENKLYKVYYWWVSPYDGQTYKVFDYAFGKEMALLRKEQHGETFIEIVAWDDELNNMAIKSPVLKKGGYKMERFRELTIKQAVTRWCELNRVTMPFEIKDAKLFDKEKRYIKADCEGDLYFKAYIDFRKDKDYFIPVEFYVFYINNSISAIRSYTESEVIQSMDLRRF